MNSDGNIAAHPSMRPNVSGQQNLTVLVDFFYLPDLWMISVDMPVIKVVERCFQLGLNYFIFMKYKLLHKLHT